ncbi:hypothetical protein TNIN_488371 [Trichonephila inaurata madagascariensis]|uniref:Uncharacterized protein n=1 Tax=Trichonephila inaurata madagascariensis TaxID=2747483 RepID=A0A8X6WXT8_9ARAC|nr:hypothetical protein TNIN_488371 [Trichonephila inaurata madagascariensis]
MRNQSVADVSKSRRHSSVATLPVREPPQIEKPLSNVSKTLNTSVKRSQRHKESTPKNDVLYSKSAKQSLIKKNIEIVDLSSDSRSEKSPADEEVCRRSTEIYQQKLKGQEKSPFKTTRRIPLTLVKDVRQEKSPSKPEQSPVATVSTNEEAGRESHGDALMGINESSPFLPDPKDKRVSKRRECNLVITTAEIHNEEGPLRIKPSVTRKKILVSKNQSCIYYGPEMIEVHESIEIPQREQKKDETFKNISNNIENLNRNAEHCPVTRGIFRNSVYHLRPKHSSSVLEEPSVKRKRPRATVEHFEPEETPSESEQSPVKKGKTRINTGLYHKKSASKVRPSRSENNNEEPLRIKPSVTKKRYADSSVKRVRNMLTRPVAMYESSMTHLGRHL